jgi:membrane protease YdiL (CAAX protease family)
MTEGQAKPSFDDRLATRLRAFGPLGIFAMLVIVAGTIVVAPLGAIFVLVWVWLSRTPWREIGYVRPKSWAGAIVLGIVFGVVFKLLMKAVVMPLLVTDPINHVYHYMTGNEVATAQFAVYAVIGAGWGEETLFRGYLFERLGKLFGSNVFAKAIIVVLTTAIFASLHYAQGWPGIEQAAVTGLVFGTIFALTGRLFMLMVAHAAFDLTAAAIIYFDAESQVAHLIFK